MKIAVVGVGLIGGSFVLDLKKAGLVDTVIGVDRSEANLARAKELGIIDESLSLEDAAKVADVIAIAIPVDSARTLLPTVLDMVEKDTVVVDLGSSKAGICEVAKSHPRRAQYVACHPIAGTEFSGPDAAHHGLFAGKVNIICDKEESSEEALALAEKMFAAVGMSNTHMDSKEHDRHIAYVSHLSHVTSFTLGLTVLDIEKNEKNIFNMAGSGFASTVRLAKSSPEMWSPIFEQNADNVVEALDAYMNKLAVFRDAIKERKRETTYQMISEGNDIRRILEGIELKNKEKNGNNG